VLFDVTQRLPREGPNLIRRSVVDDESGPPTAQIYTRSRPGKRIPVNSLPGITCEKVAVWTRRRERHQELKFTWTEVLCLICHNVIERRPAAYRNDGPTRPASASSDQVMRFASRICSRTLWNTGQITSLSSAAKALPRPDRSISLYADRS
jgi:hypothetical protein